MNLPRRCVSCGRSSQGDRPAPTSTAAPHHPPRRRPSLPIIIIQSPCFYSWSSQKKRNKIFAHFPKITRRRENKHSQQQRGVLISYHAVLIPHELCWANIWEEKKTDESFSSRPRVKYYLKESKRKKHPRIYYLN